MPKTAGATALQRRYDWHLSSFTVTRRVMSLESQVLGDEPAERRGRPCANASVLEVVALFHPILSDNFSLGAPLRDCQWTALAESAASAGATAEGLTPASSRFGSIGSSYPPSRTPVRTITSSLSGNT